MDAINFLLVRYGDLHRGLIGDLLGKLSEAQVRGRPHPGVNTVAWLLWHTARVEDVGVNRFIADRPQVLEDRWLDRLGVPRRDVGTGMNDAEVDDLSARIDLQALRGHWEGVVSSEGAVAARADGSRTSGRRAGAGRGSSPRFRCCTSTATTSRRGWRRGSGEPAVSSVASAKSC